MNQLPLIGSKVRRLRRRGKLTQVDLAARLGISPSYLNLIEHNQRALTRPLLLKLGAALRVDPQDLSGGEEARLLSDLIEVFGDPLFRDGKVSHEELTGLVGTAPVVAAAILSLYGAYREAQEDALRLSERLADNPFLEATSHRLLTLLTSIRSFSEILRDNADLAAGRRQHYIGTVASESEKLTDLVNELFGFFSTEGPARQQPGDSPETAVTDHLEATGTYSEELEDAADAIRGDLRATGPDLAPALAMRLTREHGVAVEIVPLGGMGGADTAEFDEAARRLRLSEIMPPSSRTFEMARRLALAAAGPRLDSLVERAALAAPGAASLLRLALSKYVAAAVLMPYDQFFAAARDLRHDIEILQSRFAVSFEQACQRLTTLQRPGAEGIPFHFLRVDVAGSITKRFSASGLRIPRFGGACPRWNVYHAFMNPGQIETQVARLPEGETYIFLARAQTRPGPGHRAPKRHYSVSIGCDVSFADALVYADGLRLQDESSLTPVGIHCRQCPRHDCRDRTFPAVLHRTGPGAREYAADDTEGSRGLD